MELETMETLIFKIEFELEQVYISLTLFGLDLISSTVDCSIQVSIDLSKLLETCYSGIDIFITFKFFVVCSLYFVVCTFVTNIIPSYMYKSWILNECMMDWKYTKLF